LHHAVLILRIYMTKNTTPD